MKKVKTYGTCDLFHEGHRRLLERAKALGDYLIVGVTTDNFDIERGKMNTCDNVMERIEAGTLSSAVASFQVGLGVKTEGNLIISGTKEYAYVPAPWWRTDYFEIRYEDQNQNKGRVYPKLSRKEMIKVAEVHEKFINGENLFII